MFWLLERDGRYVGTDSESWVDDPRAARHYQSYQHADGKRRGLAHPFWMSTPVEHARITPEVYADGLAAEIGRLKVKNERLDPTPYRDALHDLVMLRAQEIGCVPPPTKEQWAKAWRVAEELFEPWPPK